jgi:predicted nucleic acid-binding protein
MKVVVADASPINYLILIECIDVLRGLYGRVVIPPEVLNELTAEGAPRAVKSWIRMRPDWIEIESAPEGAILDAALDAGEAAAIRLALTQPDCLLLIDESEGRAVATRLRIPNTGTLGILLEAGREGFVDLRVALENLQRTNFRVSQSLIAQILKAKPKLIPAGRAWPCPTTLVASLHVVRVY